MLNIRFQRLLPAPAAGHARRINEWRDEDGVVVASAFASGPLRWIEWPGLGVFAFSPPNLTIDVWPDPDASHELITEKLLRQIQPIILQASGWQALHASAALGPSGATILCGRSGAGKSTVAYTLAGHGWHQIADDSVVWHLGDAERPRVVPLPFAPRPRDMQSLPVRRPDRLADGTVEAAPDAVAIASIVLLQQVAGAQEAAVRLPASEAFRAVLTHAHCLDLKDAGAVRAMTRAYLLLADRVPVFHLTYAPDPSSIGELAARIAQLAQPAGPPPTTARAFEAV